MSADFEYDFAISFAEAQRSIAKKIYDDLNSDGISVFYDKANGTQMLGQNIVDYLRQVYSESSRFCVALLSREYDASEWTNLEKECFQDRELKGEKGFFIPVLVSEYRPKWLPKTRMHFDLPSRSVEELIGELRSKLNEAKLVLATRESRTSGLQSHGTPQTFREKLARIDLILKIDPDAITESQMRSMVSDIATSLGLKESDVRIISVVKSNSSRVRIELPFSGAKTLYELYQRQDKELTSLIKNIYKEDVLLRVENLVETDGLKAFSGTIASTRGSAEILPLQSNRAAPTAVVSVASRATRPGMRKPRTVQVRVYNFAIELPGVSGSSLEARTFLSKTAALLQKGRTILQFDLRKETSNCIIVARVACPSCGPSSLARFTRSLTLAFPKVVVVKVSKERKYQ